MAHPSIETFDIALQFPHGCQLYRGGVVSGIDAGMLQRRQTVSSVFPNGQAAVRRWTVNVQNANANDYNRAAELYEETAGGCEPLDMTVRGMTLDGSTSETVQVRMMDMPLMLNSVGPRNYSFRLELEEFGHAP